MSALARTLRFTAFTLVEYARSGRILVELAATVAAFYLFFRRWDTPMQPEYFFSTTGLFTLALTFYTASTVLGLGDRPQGYLVLARRLGRAGYLLGLYLAVQALIWGVYGALSLGVALYNPVQGLGLRGWLLGTAPLLLNVALLSALLVLLAPMVLSTGWRLAILAVVALAFSGNLIGGPTLATLPPALATALDVLRTIFSTPLLPAFTGFALAVSRDYSGISVVIPLAQLSLTLGLLSLAIYTFSRRELIFSGA
ncbi:MAG TPA: hypothetical protein VNL77_05455 [Roseiflexaceae bacterium]|nr:hypothetical protein [Roseiflexaceae bacterium]